MIQPSSRILYAFEMNFRQLSYLCFSYPKWFGPSHLIYHSVLAFKSQVLYFTMFYYIYYVLLYFNIFYYVLLCLTIFYYVLIYRLCSTLLYFTMFYYILQCFTIFYYVLLYFTMFCYILLCFTEFNMLYEQERDPKL